MGDVIRDEPGGGRRRREGVRRAWERGGDGDGRWVSNFRMVTEGSAGENSLLGPQIGILPEGAQGPLLIG